MKIRVGSVTLLLTYILACLPVKAQIGWKWARTATTYSFTTGSSAEGGWLASDRAGSVYVVASIGTTDSVRFDSTVLPGSSYTSVFIAKTDTSGHYVWAKGTHDAEAAPIAIASDLQGNLFVFGWYTYNALKIDTFTFNSPGPAASCFLMKINPAGTILWAKTIADSAQFGLYGGMYVDIYGNAYVTSTFSDTSVKIGTTLLTNTDHSGHSNDIFIAKFTASGDFAWGKNYGSKGNDLAVAIAPAGTGYFYFAGNVPRDTPVTIGATTLTGPHNSFYARADTNGNIVWARNFPASGFIKAFNSSFASDLYMTGGFTGTITLGAATYTSVGDADVFIAKASNAGNIVWGKTAGGSTQDIGLSLATDRCGKLWVSGSMGDMPFTGSYSMNFNGHTLTAPTVSFDPVFLAEYDTSGNYITAMPFSSGGDDFTGIITDNAGNLFFGGDYLNVPINFGPYLLDTTNTGGEYFYTAKYTYDTSLCPEVATEVPAEHTSSAINSVTIYPNPSASECTILATPGFPPNTRAELYDLTGRLMTVFILSGNNTKISVNGLAHGIYQCRIITADGQAMVKKLVVMR